MNKNITIHLDTTPDNLGDYIIRLHGNAIIKHQYGRVWVCDGGYPLSRTTKASILELLGGEFRKSQYYVNGVMIELSSDWQVIAGKQD